MNENLPAIFAPFLREMCASEEDEFFPISNVAAVSNG